MKTGMIRHVCRTLHSKAMLPCNVTQLRSFGNTAYSRISPQVSHVSIYCNSQLRLAGTTTFFNYRLHASRRLFWSNAGTSNVFTSLKQSMLFGRSYSILRHLLRISAICFPIVGISVYFASFSIASCEKPVVRKKLIIENPNDQVSFNLSLADAQRVVGPRYKLLKRLGHGQYSIVFEGICVETGVKTAFKIIPKSLTNSVGLHTEVAVMSLRGRHPNIVNLIAILERQDFVVLIVDLAEGGELFDRLVKLGRMSETQTRRLFRQVIYALRHLHSAGVSHNDIKPENILLTSNRADANIKLADFGLSRLCDSLQKTGALPGTWAYWAPELFFESRILAVENSTSRGVGLGSMVEKKSESLCLKSADMWSLGVVLYIMVCMF